MQEWKSREQIAGVENAGVEKSGANRRAAKCGSGKIRSRSQGWKMQEWKSREQIAGLENAGVGLLHGKPTAIIQRDSLKLLTENCL